MESNKWVWFKPLHHFLHTVRRPTFPCECLEPFPHGISASRPMLEVLLRGLEACWPRSTFQSSMRTKSWCCYASPSVLMTGGSLGHSSEEPHLEAAHLGRTHWLALPLPLMSSVPCPRLWVCNKGEACFPDSDSQGWSPATARPGILFGACSAGNRQFPKAETNGGWSTTEHRIWNLCVHFI